MGLPWQRRLSSSGLVVGVHGPRERGRVCHQLHPRSEILRYQRCQRRSDFSLGAWRSWELMQAATEKRCVALQEEEDQFLAGMRNSKMAWHHLRATITTGSMFHAAC